MTRLSSIAVAIATLTLGGLALAESQAEIAAKLNEEGKELMFGNHFPEASAKFAEAVARVPDAKYFFNLCTSRFQEGKFGLALTACNAVYNNSPTAAQKDKTDRLVGKINDEAKAQGIALQPEGGGGTPDDVCTANPQDPSCVQTPPPDACQANPNDPACAPRPPATGPSGNPPAAVGRPPAQGLFTGTAPDNKYTWTLGVDVFGGGGKIGRKGAFGTSAGGFRVKGDYLLNPRTRVGAQAYFQLSHYGQGEGDAMTAQTLDVFDVGLAAYKHLCKASQRLCFTPLLGAQLALMSPANEMDSTGSQVFKYAAFGARAELGLQYALGSRYEHVLSIMGGANFYTKVFSDPSDGESLSAQDWGLDKGGVAGYFGVGYMYRFNTPLGSSPFVTLE